MLYTHVFIVLKLEGNAENPRNVEVMDEINAVLQTVVLKPGEDMIVNTQTRIERLIP